MSHSQEHQQEPSESSENDVEYLVNEGLPIVEEQLLEHGSFSPFAIVLLTSNEVQEVNLVKEDGDEVSGAEMLSLLTESLQAAANETYRALAIFVDVQIDVPVESEGGESAEEGKGTKESDAVQVGVEHASGYTMNIFFPYSQKENAIDFGEYFGGERQAEVLTSSAGANSSTGNHAGSEGSDAGDE
ncbi:MAG: hypothetical protein AAF517_04510 [Planctomycetota bacterium]